MLLRGSGGKAIGLAVLASAAIALPCAAADQRLQPLQPAGKTAPPDGEILVTPRLALDRAALVPGKTALLAVIFDIEPGWHLYWMNPGDTGLGPTVNLTLPEGITQAGELLWPYPTRYPHAGFMVDNIYEDELVLLAPIAVSPDLPPGSSATIRAELDWLVCADICLPGSGRSTLNARVADPGAQPARSDDAERIRKALARVPAPAERAADLGATAEWDAHTLVIRVKGADAVTYFHNEPRNAPPRDMLSNGARAGDTLRLPFPERIAEHESTSGVVVFTRDGREQAVWILAPRAQRSASRR